jgi:hypothetical protein
MFVFAKKGPKKVQSPKKATKKPQKSHKKAHKNGRKNGHKKDSKKRTYKQTRGIRKIRITLDLNFWKSSGWPQILILTYGLMMDPWLVPVALGKRHPLIN